MHVRAIVAALASAILAQACTSSPDPDAILFRTGDGAPVYSERFRPTDRDGYVLVECVALDDGRMSDCAVIEERPAWDGSAGMAQRVEETARLNPDAPGFRAGARVHWPVRFRLDP